MTKTPTSLAIADAPFFVMTKQGCLGRIVHLRDGWHFYSNVSSHGNSRRGWPSPVDCIPSWADKMMTDVIGRDEFNAQPRVSITN